MRVRRVAHTPQASQRERLPVSATGMSSAGRREECDQDGPGKTPGRSTNPDPLRSPGTVHPGTVEP